MWTKEPPKNHWIHSGSLIKLFERAIWAWGRQFRKNQWNYEENDPISVFGKIAYIWWFLSKSAHFLKKWRSKAQIARLNNFIQLPECIQWLIGGCFGHICPKCPFFNSGRFFLKIDHCAIYWDQNLFINSSETVFLERTVVNYARLRSRAISFHRPNSNRICYNRR